MDDSMGNIIRKLMGEKLNTMWTAVPCKVINVYKMTADVEPRVRGFGIIANIPVAIIRGGNAGIIPPVAIGDVVLVLFSKYALDTMLNSKSQTSFDTRPTFAYADAIIISCFVLGSETGTTVIGTKKWEIIDNTLRILAADNIEIHGDNVTIDGESLLVFNGGGSGDGVVRKSDNLTVSGNTGPPSSGPAHTHPVSLTITINTASTKVRCG